MRVGSGPGCSSGALALHNTATRQSIHRSATWAPPAGGSGEAGDMLSIPAVIKKYGLFLRRRDLLGLGYADV
ncbi:MAG: hypothetical protein ABI310_08095, partial [Microbacteriaceae bacterium]